ncbi:FAD-binding domain [Mycobacterium vicinigordonae]|uniref:FAD-binding domain n=1 Tax=Mycobacterium vicinigordonae TaxID=1719132 RepID=A0A7D6DVZ2_9MYCO|nr:FAD-binding domain [Mycobacterium vicinigordonae]QLL05928.1 FAD-binding domain [Mycobacterium vicinigordonae]
MKVAISGAGVAGPALAYWLHRIGHEPTLIEHAQQLRTGGYVIDFWGVGYRIAKRMGLEATIRDAGYQVQSVRSVGPDGQIEADLGLDGLRRAVGGELTSLARGDLAAIIYATIGGGVETIFGDTITEIGQQTDGVELSFAHAGARTFDLLIGADGLHSNVRRLMSGPDSQPAHYLGCLVAACVVEGYRPRDELVYVTYSRPGRSVGRFTLRDDRTMFLFVFRSPDSNLPEELEARKSLLWREFGDSGWECKQILAAVDAAEDLYFDVVSQIRLNRWWHGRVALLGDAAGCVSLLAGEGTGLAIAEAYVLAGELLAAQGDHQRAFQAYQTRMRPIVKARQASAQQLIPVFATKTQLGIRFRHLVMRAMNFDPLGEFLVSRSLRDNIDLPDYPM